MTHNELTNAVVKMERALYNEGTDPATGYTADEVYDYIANGCDADDTPPEVAQSGRAYLDRVRPV